MFFWGVLLFGIIGLELKIDHMAIIMSVQGIDLPSGRSRMLVSPALERGWANVHF